MKWNIFCFLFFIFASNSFSQHIQEEVFEILAGKHVVVTKTDNIVLQGKLEKNLPEKIAVILTTGEVKLIDKKEIQFIKINFSHNSNKDEIENKSNIATDKNLQRYQDNQKKYLKDRYNSCLSSAKGYSTVSTSFGIPGALISFAGLVCLSLGYDINSEEPNKFYADKDLYITYGWIGVAAGLPCVILSIIFSKLCSLKRIEAKNLLSKLLLTTTTPYYNPYINGYGLSFSYKIPYK